MFTYMRAEEKEMLIADYLMEPMLALNGDGSAGAGVEGK